MTTKPTSRSIQSIREGIRSGSLTAVEVVNKYLESIAAQDSEIKAFLHIDSAGARSAAEAVDRQHAEGHDVPALAGTVVAVKDNIAVRGLPATAGSKILENYVAPYDATVIERLRKAGAIVIGKTNLDEFAMGASTEHSAFQPTKNPRDLTKVPGGSSGGSAAAVAANFCTVALGSDTGGSVRQPAAFCGLVGFRPTYGSVSRNGLIAMASSMDVIGPLARNVADARVLYAAIAGYDPKDATTLPHVAIDPVGGKKQSDGLRVGIPREYVEAGLSSEVAAGFAQVRRAIEKLGATIVEISLPSTELAVPTYYIITPAEASSNLGRYDSIRYGQAHQAQVGHAAATSALRGRLFGSEPKRRMLLGAFTLSAGHADRYYHMAQRVRTLLRQDFAAAFQAVDVLLTPTTPTTAFPLGSVTDPVEMYRQDIFLAAASLAGVPAMSLPVPSVSGLPVGVQLIGPAGADAKVFDAAELLEQSLA